MSVESSNKTAHLWVFYCRNKKKGKQKRLPWQEAVFNVVDNLGRLSPTGRRFGPKVSSWNSDLSPWKAPAVFGREDFGGGAERTLEEVLNHCADRKKTYIIGGYSLAGLFALWAAYQTDVFAAVAAASPSIWFPGFVDFMKENEIRCKAVYLSLGDKEEKARNPVMASVGACIREASEVLKNKEVNTILEWNPGNHFKDADIRTARAFAWARSVI